MSKQKNTVHSKRVARFSVDLITPMLFCFFEAILLLSLTAVLSIFNDGQKSEQLANLVSIIAIIFYLCSAGTLCLVYALKAKRVKKAKYEAMQTETEIYDMFRYIIDLPYAISDGEGRVKIMNGALQDILGYKNAISGIDFSEICSVPIKDIIHSARNREDYIEGELFDMPRPTVEQSNNIATLSDLKRYSITSYVFKIKGENYYFIVFKDINDFLEALEKKQRESAVVAYIVLDNLQELTQYVRADYRLVSTEVETALKSWMEEINGFIREYEKDKYIAVFSKQELDRQMQNDFEIQRRIMKLQIGDNSFPVTISMGIAADGESYKEREQSAFNALHIAIQRGGNQVAIKQEGDDGYIFFGGTHKIIENNTSVISRVSGDILEKKIRSASNILIMGHANPDFDSIGACVGLARFATAVLEDEYRGSNEQLPQVNIVTDKCCESFEVCASQLMPLEEYNSIFIAKDAARDLITSETVLLITDVNNPKIYASPELAETISDIGVIDHHRLADTLPFEPFLQYIETTKSSASEMVAEILLRSQFSADLHKEEAEVLLAGIMLDTNNFTRNAGAQTFEMIHYLYSRGAHTGVVREFFNENLDDILLKGEFESKAKIYRDCIAITVLNLERESSPNDRIIAAKVADNLLRIKGVEASFALVKIDDDVAISGRSKGKINVQLILERLKGGGHFDIAGAQIKNAEPDLAGAVLRDAIDDYFELDFHDHDSQSK